MQIEDWQRFAASQHGHIRKRRNGETLERRLHLEDDARTLMGEDAGVTQKLQRVAKVLPSVQQDCLADEIAVAPPLRLCKMTLRGLKLIEDFSPRG